MEAKTLQALKESIAHWERMREGKQYAGEVPDADHCALCKLYYGDPEEPGCEGCPISEKTGLRDCNGTPFRYARKWWNTKNQSGDDFDEAEFKKAAQQMIDYLKSLLPTTDPLGVNSCKHPECGRFYDHNAKRMSCTAIAHGACACPSVQEQEGCGE